MKGVTFLKATLALRHSSLHYAFSSAEVHFLMGSNCSCQEQSQTPDQISITLSPQKRQAQEADASFVIIDLVLSPDDINKGLKVYIARKTAKTPALSTAESPIPAREDPNKLLSRAARKVLERLPAFSYDLSTSLVVSAPAQQLPNGSIYIGEWEMHRGTLLTRSGKGKLYGQNGAFYEGYWKDGELQGVGREIEPNGDYYEGGFEANKRHGAGTFVSYSGLLTYSGSWRSGIRHGFGQENASGIVYEGPFQEGHKTGRGRLLLAEGEYVGDVVDGMREGLGTWVGADGRYEGMWKADKLEGAVEWMSEEGEIKRFEYANGRKVKEIQ